MVCTLLFTKDITISLLSSPFIINERQTHTHTNTPTRQQHNSNDTRTTPPLSLPWPHGNCKVITYTLTHSHSTKKRAGKKGDDLHTLLTMAGQQRECMLMPLSIPTRPVLLFLAFFSSSFSSSSVQFRNLQQATLF